MRNKDIQITATSVAEFEKIQSILNLLSDDSIRHVKTAKTTGFNDVSAYIEYCDSFPVPIGVKTIEQVEDCIKVQVDNANKTYITFFIKIYNGKYPKIIFPK